MLSGAGISAESGLGVFRGSGGLWENFKIEEVASIEGWHADPAKVLQFYNLRRKQAGKAEPNEGHYALARMQAHFDVTVITQNVDDLHERAGSNNVLHLHGKLNQAKSQINENYCIDLGNREIALGELCPYGAQLRPNIVWFGEAVPLYDKAREIVSQADRFIIVGTSLQVYPAAGLVNDRRSGTETVLIDPNQVDIDHAVRVIQSSASQALPRLLEEWLSRSKD